jgi:hypothetical protein
LGLSFWFAILKEQRIGRANQDDKPTSPTCSQGLQRTSVVPSRGVSHALGRGVSQGRARTHSIIEIVAFSPIESLASKVN